ncbi:hypothetical protein [Maritalea sp.]|uniref:hypothetical protein n=1 Tax=Maritalea sp. TaxID=2003361 RepID=UPI003EF4167B
MILGTINIKQNAVVTNKDSFLLASLSVVSVRRPFIAPSLMLCGLLVGYAAVFADLLYPLEIVSILCASTVALFLSSQIGQLKLLSRDLRGSPLGDVLWGRYSSLQCKREEIVSSLYASQLGDHHE